MPKRTGGWRTCRAQNPSLPQVPFYLGVSQLFMNQNARVIDSLQSARRLADESLLHLISWYLIVALNREGRDQQALVAASTLCAQAGEYKQKACAAADKMKRP